MERRTAYEAAPVFIAVVGLLLFVAAASHYLTEIGGLGTTTGPVVAFAIDGLPALGLVYGGYYLSEQQFDPGHSWRVFLATVAGGSIVCGVIGLSMLVRFQEGRPVSEPLFQLLIGTTAGAIAGFVGGYYYARSLTNAHEATKAMSTLAFTNDVLRHDIKNDMTVIRGRANVIADAGPDDDLVVESARTIDDQVDKVIEVIDSTSAISETLSEDPDYESIDLTTVVQDVVDHSENTLAATVTADLPESAEVYANKAVRTIVTNLVENGIEHNDASEPALHVTVEPLTDSIRLRVVDNGPGVPDDEKSTLFDPRPDDTGGGGLHVVATLVENFGGEIRVEDNEPRGAAFVVDLPRA